MSYYYNRIAPIVGSVADPDLFGHMWIRIQEVKSIENVQVHEVNTELKPKVRILAILSLEILFCIIFLRSFNP